MSPCAALRYFAIQDRHHVGRLAGAPVQGHAGFQHAQAFIDAGGCRGLQEQVLMSGSWKLTPGLRGSSRGR